MKPNEQSLIDGLFQRLQETEKKTGPRDIEAEEHIQKFIIQQPSAPYYMAQSILIQEAALNKLYQQIQELEDKITKLETIKKPASKSFLKGLFGGKSNTISKDTQEPQVLSSGNAYSNNSRYMQQPPLVNVVQQPLQSGGSNFMGGALKTAATLATGAVLGNIMTNMFMHSNTDDITKIISPTHDPLDAVLNDHTDYSLHQDSNFSNMDAYDNLSSDNNFIDNDDFNVDDFSDDSDGFM